MRDKVDRHIPLTCLALIDITHGNHSLLHCKDLKKILKLSTAEKVYILNWPISSPFNRKREKLYVNKMFNLQANSHFGMNQCRTTKVTSFTS